MKMICKHRIIRDWPSCFEDCVYASEPACPHYQQACVPVSSKPEELIEGLAELQEFEDYKIAVQSHYYLTTPVWQVEDAKSNLIKSILNHLSSLGFVDSHGLDVLLKQSEENLAKSEKTLADIESLIEQAKKEERERIATELSSKFDCRMKPETVLSKLIDWIEQALKQEGK